ncbi:hypothetical protein Tco_1059519 [Tanacetum coccineum]
MMTYLKNMGDYKHNQLKGKTYDEIHELYERVQKRIQDFIPMDSEKEVIKDSGKKDDSSSKSAGGSRKKTLARKRTGEKQTKESAKRKKLEDAAEEQEPVKSDEEATTEYEQEKKELRMWLTVVPDEEETIIRADGNTSYHKTFSSMLRKFNRQDLVDLHRLVMKRFEDNAPEGYNLLLWGDLKIMFEPNAEDEVWSNQQDLEKRYPLIKEMMQKMLNWKLEAEAESTMEFELLKFIKSQIEE